MRINYRRGLSTLTFYRLPGNITNVLERLRQLPDLRCSAKRLSAEPMLFASFPTRRALCDSSGSWRSKSTAPCSQCRWLSRCGSFWKGPEIRMAQRGRPRGEFNRLQPSAATIAVLMYSDMHKTKLANSLTIPVTGFLGAGTTTLLNRCLAEPQLAPAR